MIESVDSHQKTLPRIMTCFEYMFLWCVHLAIRWIWKLTSPNVHHLPTDEPFIIAANHLTHADALLVAGLLPSRSSTCRLRVIAKAEHFFHNANPIFKFFARLLRAIPVERDSGNSRAEALATCLSSIQQGRNILIHPEGTRSFDGTLLGFNEGAACLARKSGCKVVPCYISKAAHDIWSPDRSLPNVFYSKGPIVVLFGKPLVHSLDGETDCAFTERIRSSMLYLAHEIGEYPELESTVSSSLSGALHCQGIQKIDHGTLSGMYNKGFSYSLKPYSVQEVKAAILQAKAEGRKVIAIGSGWSRGGQALVTMKEPSLTFDMKGLNKVINVDSVSKTAVVQAGAKWVDVRKTLALHGFAPLATQSYDVFTVGGSISANAHGRSLDTPSVIGGVRSITIVDCNGEIVVTKAGDDLFNAVCGGFGLLGIIVEVTLQLTSDCLYVSELRILPTRQYVKYFDRDALLGLGVHFQFARLSCIPGNLFENTIWETCSIVESTSLDCNAGLILDSQKGKFWGYFLHRTLVWALRTGRATRLLQNVRWAVETSYRQRYVGRLERRNSTQQEDFGALLPWDGNLVEVFVPTSRLVEFLEAARMIFDEPAAPTLLNVTIRWVGQDQGTLLAYASTGPCFSLVFFVKATSNGVSAAGTSRRLYDLATNVGGSFYLTYEPWYTSEQLSRAYPKLPIWLEKKRQFDPDGMFQSSFLHILEKNDPLDAKQSTMPVAPTPGGALNPYNASSKDEVNLGVFLSLEDAMDWLSDFGNHLEWHTIVIAQFGNMTMVLPMWFPFLLALIFVVGRFWMIPLAITIVLFMYTYTIEVKPQTSEVRVSSIFLEQVFRLHAMPMCKGNPSLTVSVTVSKKAVSMSSHRQVKDAHVVLWKLKQFGHHLNLRREEEAVVQAGCAGACLEKEEVATKDGICIHLTRLRNKCIIQGQRTAVFFSGYGVSSFRSASLHLIPYLLGEEFSEVWVVETRISSHLDGIQCNRRLDDVALFDIPCAISHIRQKIGPQTPLHVIANCIGALTVFMSLVAKATPESDITSLTLLNVGLTPKLKKNIPGNWAMLLLRLLGLSRGTEPAARVAPERRNLVELSIGHRLLEFFFERIHTNMDTILTNSGLINARYGGVSMAVNGGLYLEENLSPATRSAMMGYHVGGRIHFDFIQHFTQMQQATDTARAKRYSPAPYRHMQLLPEDYLEVASILRLPIFGFVGSKNEYFGDSICQTFVHLERDRPVGCIQELTIVPGFGHLDLFMGPAARTTWFPKMMKSLLSVEKATN